MMQNVEDNISLKDIESSSNAYFFYIAQQNSQTIYFKIYGSCSYAPLGSILNMLMHLNLLLFKPIVVIMKF